MRPHFCMNEHWFSTLERLKKKHINRLISVADMRVALAALSIILAASISIITNLIQDIPLCYELKIRPQ